MPATTHTGCLIKFQNDEVDAITGDDTVLAGLAAQDPYAVVPEQIPLNPEPYGVGVNIEDDRSSWRSSTSRSRRWSSPATGSVPTTSGSSPSSATPARRRDRPDA